MVLYNPRFPQVGKGTSKSALTTTMITGCNAAGDPIPPHLQFQSKAKTKEKMKLQYNVAEHMPCVIGQFGCEEVCSWLVTFGANEKGGMDSEEFEKFVLNSIVLLFPHAKNKKGLRIMLKVDSGPGRMNLNLLTRLRRLGFILYPCVPNTTHVTQETDQLYGPFKTTFIENLNPICDARMRKNVSLSLQPKLVGLPLFRGVDTDSECHVEVSAFEQGFSKQKCVALFERIGAATKDGVTCACLQNKQVMIAIRDGNEETDMLHHAVQTANNNAVHQLIHAKHLWATIFKKEWWRE